MLGVFKKYIIDSQWYVALMGTALAMFFMFLKNQFSLSMLGMVFCTYFCGYLYTKYQSYKNRFRKLIGFLVVIGGLMLGLMMFEHRWQILLRWLMVVAVGLLYNSTILNHYVRKIPLMKIFYVGLAWGLVNGWLILDVFDFQIFFLTWFYISALVLPFDIRDMDVDKVVTFPKLIGVEGTKILAYLLLIIAAILAWKFLEFPYHWSFIISVLISFLAVHFSKKTNREIYFSFWVETCCGLPLLILILFWLIN